VGGGEGTGLEKSKGGLAGTCVSARSGMFGGALRAWRAMQRRGLLDGMLVWIGENWSVRSVQNEARPVLIIQIRLYISLSCIV